MIVFKELGPRPRLWSEEEFRRLAELGWFSFPAELHEGQVFEKGCRRRWKGDEIYRLLDLGFFQGERIELIEGELYEMAAQKNLHAAGITLSEDALRLAFGPGFWIRVQMSLDLSPYSTPDPDLAVVQGTPRTLPLHQNPTTALLLVEVSETTLSYDRDIKGSLYARSGIADYWILNLINRQLEVYRTPVVAPARVYGMEYQDVAFFGTRDVVTPLAAPWAQIQIVDLLP